MRSDGAIRPESRVQQVPTLQKRIQLKSTRYSPGLEGEEKSVGGRDSEAKKVDLDVDSEVVVGHSLFGHNHTRCHLATSLRHRIVHKPGDATKNESR